MAVFVCGLLFYANAVAFNLISAPSHFGDIVAYSALTVAVTLTIITLAIVIRDKRSDTAAASVIAQVSTNKVDSYAELFRQFGVQKTISKLEAGTLEQEKQLPKKPVFPPTKVFCPACRKEFSLPIYEREYIVDFGRPKRSNLIKRCPHCLTSIPLKRRGVVEEVEIWKD